MGGGKHTLQYCLQYSNGLIFQYYSVRALLWKVALNYLSYAKSKWVSTMERNLIKYLGKVKEHVVESVNRKHARNQITQSVL